MKEWEKKQREFEEVKARAKALRLRLTCTICGAKPKTLLNCPCGTTQYCSTDCQRIDWRDRGHRKACKKIRDERAVEAARAEAPTPPPSPPKPVVYGPAPRSHADEVRARIAAEHEAARLRREANPEPEPTSARFGSRCPICMDEWDVNETQTLRVCCCRMVCTSCHYKIGSEPCPLCRSPHPTSEAEDLARLRRHAENEVPEAISHLGLKYFQGAPLVAQNFKKAAKIYKRAVELGDVDAFNNLGHMYQNGTSSAFIKRYIPRPIPTVIVTLILHRTGKGVKQDTKKAMQLYRMAAEKGDAVAQFNLGMSFKLLSGPDEAMPWFKMAAEQSYTHAEFHLGICLLEQLPDGDEVKYEAENAAESAAAIVEARRWLQRAADKGDDDSIEMLRSISVAFPDLF